MIITVIKLTIFLLQDAKLASRYSCDCPSASSVKIAKHIAIQTTPRRLLFSDAKVT